MKISLTILMLCITIGLSGCGSSGGSPDDSSSSTVTPSQETTENEVLFNYSVRSKYLENSSSAISPRVQSTGSSLSSVTSPSAIQARPMTSNSLGGNSRSIDQWPDYSPPSLSATLEGPWDFSGGINLWFHINYTNESGAISQYLVKLDDSIGDTATAITSSDIFFEIVQSVGNDLIITQSPLTITGPNESAGHIELVPAIESGMVLTDIGFASDNRYASGGINGTFNSPELISSENGPFDFSGDNNLWFKIKFTDENDNLITHQVKLDNSIGANPEQTTQQEIHSEIVDTVGSDLLIGYNPISIKAPIDAQGTLILEADIELGITLSQLGFDESNRLSTGDGNGSGEQYTGTLTIYDQANSEYQYIPWSIYIEQEGFSVLSNSTLALPPGNYLVSLLVSNLNKQYGGEGVIEVSMENQINFDLALLPIVGNVEASVDDISVYSQVKVAFTLEQLNEINVPRLGLVINSQDEYIFDVSKADSINEFYLNTLQTVNTFYFKFYDDAHLIGKSDSFSSDVLFNSDASAEVDLYPLISEIDFTFNNQAQYPSEITLRIPSAIVNELGGSDNLTTIVSLAGNITDFQEYSLQNMVQQDDWYVLNTPIQIGAFETITLELEFQTTDTQEALGGCSSDWDVTSFEQTLVCASRVLGDNVVNTSLKSIVSINTVSILGNPVSGVIVKDQFDQVWGISGDTSVSEGFLSYRVLPGDYQLTGTINDEVVITQSISVSALQAINVILQINDASLAAHPQSSCRELYSNNSQLTSGFYNIDVDGPALGEDESNAASQVVYCNMDEQGGGWTLVGYHTNHRAWKIVATVSPDASHTLGAGLMADIFWQQVKETATTGMMFIDDAGNVSKINIDAINNATCVNPFDDIESLINLTNNSHPIFLTNDSQCDLTYETRSAVVLQEDSAVGVSLYKGTDNVFEVWPYDSNESSGSHDGMWIFIK